MTKFNQSCPSHLLPQLETEYQSCLLKQTAACERYVEIYRQLLPEYDCQRPFDATPTVNYIVPAIWLARDNEKYVDLLSKLQLKSAQTLFASSEFRRTLDGYVAGAYREKSQQREKQMKRR